MSIRGVDRCGPSGSEASRSGLGASSRIAALVAALLFLSACALTPATDEIVILHTNDVHGNIRPIAMRRAGSDTPSLVGGSAALSTFIAGWRAKKGGDTGILLLDAGDIFQGTPEGNETRGGLMIAIMNRLKYDAAAVGNHELDFGVANLIERIRESRFPWMAENIRMGATGLRPSDLRGPFLIERHGVRIGLFGLTTEDLAKVTSIEPSSGWTATGESLPAFAAARMLRDSGAEIVIMVAHCGVDNDSATAVAVDRLAATQGLSRPLIDIIVGGHSHTRMNHHLLTAGTRIVQTGSRGVTCGEIRLHWDPLLRRIKAFRYRVVDLPHTRYPSDSSMEEFLRPGFEELDRRMNIVVGRALKPLKRRRDHGSSDLGNFQCDAMAEAVSAEIAFQNKGGIRTDIDAGEVKLRDLYAVSPFGNTLVTMTMSGRQVRAVVERSLSGGYTPLEIGGIVVQYDDVRPKGDRVIEVLIDSRPIDPERDYRIVTNAFLAAGGDDYPQFKAGRDVHDTGRNQLDVFVDRFRSHPGGIAVSKEERWRRVDAP